RSDSSPVVVATDISDLALELAAQNRGRIECRATLELRQGSWWEALDPTEAGRITLVVSNPPYVSRADWETLDPLVKDHDPMVALVAQDGRGGEPGFSEIEKILIGAPIWLGRPAAAVVEIAPALAEPALEVARRCGARGVVMNDLAGRPRALVARFA
ncbi:MAG: hypothetical protein ACRDVP_04065, partial [Acidimicrobiales bacterium]